MPHFLIMQRTIHQYLWGRYQIRSVLKRDIAENENTLFPYVDLPGARPGTKKPVAIGHRFGFTFGTGE